MKRLLLPALVVAIFSGPFSTAEMLTERPLNQFLSRIERFVAKYPNAPFCMFFEAQERWGIRSYYQIDQNQHVLARLNSVIKDPKYAKMAAMYRAVFTPELVSGNLVSGNQGVVEGSKHEFYSLEVAALKEAGIPDSNIKIEREDGPTSPILFVITELSPDIVTIPEPEILSNGHMIYNFRVIRQFRDLWGKIAEFNMGSTDGKKNGPYKFDGEDGKDEAIQVGLTSLPIYVRADGRVQLYASFILENPVDLDWIESHAKQEVPICRSMTF